MRRNAFKPYSPGEKVSNSRVLGIAHLDGTLTRYRVKNLCCGEEVVLAHKSLNDRRRRGVLQCARCSARTNQSQGRATALEERQREQTMYAFYSWAQRIWASTYKAHRRTT